MIGSFGPGLPREKQYSECPWIQILRKEVIQPQVPLRLPCYDLVPIRKSGVGVCEDDFGRPSLSWLDGRCVQGSGTHSPQCC